MRRSSGVLGELDVRRVIDLGCGSGQLVSALLDDPGFTEIVGVDVSTRALTIAGRRLRLDRMPERRRERLQLFQAALTYTDRRFAGYDAAVLMEVVEHIDPPRLTALEQVVFGTARPGHVIVTTPNSEYNVRYTDLRVCVTATIASSGRGRNSVPGRPRSAMSTATASTSVRWVMTTLTSVHRLRWRSSPVGGADV
ncbi:class I SAM-dependent methyltransferase [Rhodococcus oxybenzonivorans]|uniref:class I SAM-dependent methyltransferase n=1 Tax=Rhodococcus oxybenzonivorans TaxID=1990687 RepID=UPI003001F665